MSLIFEGFYNFINNFDKEKFSYKFKYRDIEKIFYDVLEENYFPKIKNARDKSELFNEKDKKSVYELVYVTKKCIKGYFDSTHKYTDEKFFGEICTEPYCYEIVSSILLLSAYNLYNIDDSYEINPSPYELLYFIYVWVSALNTYKKSLKDDLLKKLELWLQLEDVENINKQFNDFNYTINSLLRKFFEILYTKKLTSCGKSILSKTPYIEKRYPQKWVGPSLSRLRQHSLEEQSLGEHQVGRIRANTSPSALRL